MKEALEIDWKRVLYEVFVELDLVTEGLECDVNVRCGKKGVRNAKISKIVE